MALYWFLSLIHASPRRQASVSSLLAQALGVNRVSSVGDCWPPLATSFHLLMLHIHCQHMTFEDAIDEVSLVPRSPLPNTSSPRLQNNPASVCHRLFLATF